MSNNLDSVISRFIYINVYYWNRQVDISETEVYIQTRIQTDEGTTSSSLVSVQQKTSLEQISF